ncbi:MAG: hypothetical protein DMG65_20400 [Candidatus Angelobacter sp. Gp1-AA117]|nr:MAG: hypothetical protein DMG65_20400 [Candidatus Angelobacter sp. Gp1-AA117]
MKTRVFHQAQVAVNTIAVHNPATDEVIGEIASMSPAEVAAAVERARAAQTRWSATPLAQRLRVLRKFQQLLAEQKDAVAGVITREAGKPKTLWRDWHYQSVELSFQHSFGAEPGSAHHRQCRSAQTFRVHTVLFS